MAQVSSPLHSAPTAKVPLSNNPPYQENQVQFLLIAEQQVADPCQITELFKEANNSLSRDPEDTLPS